MFRFVRTLTFVLILSAATAAGLLLWLSPDPLYTAQQWAAAGRYREYDDAIREVAEKHQLDPALVKAIVWRESAFHADKVGTSRERGLMQVGEAAGSDWAKATKLETFVPTDLFDSRMNLEAGAWYLRRALNHWKSKENPLPFALAEYNAGRTRVDRWIAATNMGDQANADDLMGAIDFPTTRRYVEEVTRRRQFYRDRGRL
jgi:soluble lytic murein transglycosylase